MDGCLVSLLESKSHLNLNLHTRLGVKCLELHSVLNEVVKITSIAL